MILALTDLKEALPLVMSHSRRWTKAAAFSASAALVLLLLAAALAYGAKDVSLPVIWEALTAYDPSLPEHAAIHGLRLPRALAALLVGASLGAAGALVQGATRNALADPGVLGINAGAALAVVLCFALSPWMGYGLVMLASFGGAAAATAVIALLAWLSRGGFATLELTIGGAVVSAMAHSLAVGLAIYFELSQDLAFWYAGGLAAIRWEQLRLLAPVLVLGLLLAVLLGRRLSLLSLGDEAAEGLGARTGRTRLAALGLMAVLAGASVSAAGSIGFIGLIAPHAARRLAGTDYRLVVPLSALLGAALLLAADLASRTVQPPREFAVGAMAAFVGVPFFLYLARRERREL